jgi:hypothetical protein
LAQALTLPYREAPGAARAPGLAARSSGARSQVSDRDKILGPCNPVKGTQGPPYALAESHPPNPPFEQDA